MVDFRLFLCIEDTLCWYFHFCRLLRYQTFPNLFNNRRSHFDLISFFENRLTFLRALLTSLVLFLLCEKYLRSISDDTAPAWYRDLYILFDGLFPLFGWFTGHLRLASAWFDDFVWCWGFYSGRNLSFTYVKLIFFLWDVFLLDEEDFSL